MARSRLFPPSVDPGKPLEPQCPSGWIRRSFGDLVNEVQRPVRLEPEVEYLLVNAKRNRAGITIRERKIGRDIKVKSQFQIKAGDFLVSKRQIVHGACGIVPRELDGAIVSNEYLVLRSGKDLDLRYFSHLTHSPYFQRTCFHSSIGVDVEKMVFKADQWMRFHLPLPPLGEQRKISDVLCAIDDVAERTEAVIAQLKALRKAILRTLLTRGVSACQEPSSEVETGEIPEGWEMVNLLDVAELPSGQVDPREQPYADWPLVAPNHIESGTGRLLLTETASKQRAKSGKYLFQAGDVVYSKIRPYLQKAWLATFNGLSSADMYPLKPSARLRPGFLLAILLGQDFTEFAESVSMRTGIPKINRKELAAYRFPLPPPNEQATIEAVLAGIDARVEAESAELLAVREVRLALSSVLLSGEVRVSPQG